MVLVGRAAIARLFEMICNFYKPLQRVVCNGSIVGTIALEHANDLEVGTATIANTTGFSTVVTVPEGEVWQLQAVHAYSANQTYSAVCVHPSPSSMPTAVFTLATAAGMIGGQLPFPMRIKGGDMIRMIIASSTNTGTLYYMFRRVKPS